MIQICTYDLSAHLLVNNYLKKLDSPICLSSDLMDLESLPAHSFHFDGFDAVFLLLSVSVDFSCGPKVCVWVTRITTASKENNKEEKGEILKKFKQTTKQHVEILSERSPSNEMVTSFATH